MKNYFKTSVTLLLAGIAALGFTSCSDNDDNPTPATVDYTVSAQQLQDITKQYVPNTINITYKDLAVSTGNLYNDLKDLAKKFNNDPSSVSQSDIDAVCQEFIKARGYYEGSEAFLFGAATDFGIDPHIDTWPLAPTELASTLSTQVKYDQLAGVISGNEAKEKAAIKYAAQNIGESLLGFHGIEFIIFRDGKNRTIDALKNNETHKAFTGLTVTGKQELSYAAAVAGDLRDRCWQLEYAWNADAPKEHQDRVKELGLKYTVQKTNTSYGESMLTAGNTSTSTYANIQEAITNILSGGCANIANEVANTKIGNPYSGADVNYIESPYSERSFYDFEDNIESIGNSIYGGRSDKRNSNASIMTLLKTKNPELYNKLNADYTASINALKGCQSLEGGFVKNIKDAKVGVAQKAIQQFKADLEAAADYFSKVKVAQ